MVLMALVFLKSTRTAYMRAVREGFYVFDTTNAIMPFVFMLFFSLLSYSDAKVQNFLIKSKVFVNYLLY